MANVQLILFYKQNLMCLKTFLKKYRKKQIKTVYVGKENAKKKKQRLHVFTAKRTEEISRIHFCSIAKLKDVIFGRHNFPIKDAQNKSYFSLFETKYSIHSRTKSKGQYRMVKRHGTCCLYRIC